jgi:2-amino-4-hydroxy-6-hydroxymethyldihydropteridine diphosphokinase
VTEVLIALGSNLGDRRQWLRQAVAGLSSGGLEITGGSALFETEAVGIDGGARFLNAVISAKTELSPRRVLQACLATERVAGRERSGGDAASTERQSWSSRTLDLDLLKYGELAIAESDLVVPHPRITERAFVLAPLREVAPQWLLQGISVSCWYDRVAQSDVNRLDGTENWFWH